MGEKSQPLILYIIKFRVIRFWLNRREQYDGCLGLVSCRLCSSARCPYPLNHLNSALGSGQTVMAVKGRPLCPNTGVENLFHLVCLVDLPGPGQPRQPKGW